MRILYQFPVSPFCEKARWMLDYKELHFQAKNLVLGLHQPFALYRTKQTQLPILLDEQKWYFGSLNIAEYLDDRYAEYPLILRDKKQDILHLEESSQQLGKYIRFCILSHALQDQENPILLSLLGEKGLLKKYQQISDKVFRKTINQYLKRHSKSLAETEQEMYQLLDFYNKKMQAKQYLVDDRFSLADISLCSMLAPLLNIADTPWQLEPWQSYTPMIQKYHDDLNRLELADYVRRIYQHHRHARVDWRGI
ncbi:MULTISPECIES: glutathione S-transferase family protein [unclassified Acinetobacter]|uniref:glutathione S-transferase family protein n=1 Tax=unclassified Acinetobacter TaxID=196816 RepID=UPI0035B8D373